MLMVLCEVQFSGNQYTDSHLCMLKTSCRTVGTKRLRTMVPGWWTVPSAHLWRAEAVQQHIRFEGHGPLSTVHHQVALLQAASRMTAIYITFSTANRNRSCSIFVQPSSFSTLWTSTHNGLVMFWITTMYMQHLACLVMYMISLPTIPPQAITGVGGR